MNDQKFKLSLISKFPNWKLLYPILQSRLQKERHQAHKLKLLEDYFKTSSYFVGVQEVVI
jgi:hypothetical protein